jgi:large subunit ribosomal protein L23
VSAISSKERLMTVLLGPHVSEKTTDVADRHNQYAFKVRRGSTKADVRKAVELLFEVSVTDVQVVNCRGKVKRFGKDYGRRQNWKKAYVTLAKGQNIDFMGVD